MNFKILFPILIGAVIFLSCNDFDNFTTDSSAKLSFSTDTVLFDTIFTTIGSTTLNFKLYNPNDKAVKTTISLGGGAYSYYRLNIDGESTSIINNYEILPNDSAYVFVEVNIDPQMSNNPMVITDSVLFFTNGNQQNVKLVSYGQDVYLIRDSVLNTQTWYADKPYLVYDYVLIDENQTLTIKEGAHIHFHNESAMWVLGTLKVEGSAENKVVFEGDRLDADYDHVPSQWYGQIDNDNGSFLVGGLFLFPSSKQNTINHAIIKNGGIGIQLFDTVPNKNLKLELSNSVIHNMSAVGLTSQFSNFKVYNSVIGNCGYSCVYLSLGGSSEFYHTTIGNIYEFETRKNESLVLNNYYVDSKTEKIYTFDISSIFANSIIYGDLENEVLLDLYSEGDAQIGLKFDHCMMTVDKDFDSSNSDVFNNIIRHPDSLPHFVNTFKGNYRLDTLSAAKDKGSIDYARLYPIDQDSNDRTLDGKPDLGAYERIEE